MHCNSISLNMVVFTIKDKVQSIPKAATDHKAANQKHLNKKREIKL